MQCTQYDRYNIYMYNQNYYIHTYIYILYTHICVMCKHIGRLGPKCHRNVILDGSLRAKLADFGSGRVGPSKGAYSFGHPAGTVGYCAPEATEMLFIKANLLK